MKMVEWGQGNKKKSCVRNCEQSHLAGVQLGQGTTKKFCVGNCAQSHMKSMAHMICIQPTIYSPLKFHKKLSFVDQIC